MAAADRDWYEAYASGEEAARGLQDGEEGYEEEYEEVEIEEMTDDEPMHITGRLFLGSIDAARNIAALKRQRIGAALALLGKGRRTRLCRRTRAPWASSTHRCRLPGGASRLRTRRTETCCADCPRYLPR